MGKTIVHVSDSDFTQQVLESDVPVLVDFWAEWCGPCKMVAPILEELAEEYGDKLKVCKLDVDANTKTATDYKIRGIPAMLLFKSGHIVETTVGSVPKSQLAATIQPHLS